MDPQLKSFLVTLGISLTIGAAAGGAISFLKPQWAKRWTKFCLSGQWKLFALGALFFGTGAIVLWLDGQIYQSGLSLALCLLELAALLL